MEQMILMDRSITEAEIKVVISKMKGSTHFNGLTVECYKTFSEERVPELKKEVQSVFANKGNSTDLECC